MILVVKGSIPNKKDRLRPRKGGGMYYETGDRGAIDYIVLQLRSQWHGPPLECAQVVVKLYRKSARFDPDGQKATILDALKQAGVIIDDNAARVPDSRVIAYRGKEETVININETESPWPQPKRKRVSKAEQK